MHHWIWKIANSVLICFGDGSCCVVYTYTVLSVIFAYYYYNLPDDRQKQDLVCFKFSALRVHVFNTWTHSFTRCNNLNLKFARKKLHVHRTCTQDETIYNCILNYLLNCWILLPICKRVENEMDMRRLMARFLEGKFSQRSSSFLNLPNLRLTLRTSDRKTFAQARMSVYLTRSWNESLAPHKPAQ